MHARKCNIIHGNPGKSSNARRCSDAGKSTVMQERAVMHGNTGKSSNTRKSSNACIVIQGKVVMRERAVMQGNAGKSNNARKSSNAW